MKINSIFPKLLAAGLISGVVFAACQKSSEIKPEQAKEQITVTHAADFAATQNLVNVADMERYVMVLHPELIDEVALSGSCPPPKTYDPAPDVYPHTLTIDWGTGCTNPDGITRSGKIINLYTGDMALTGSSVTTTYDNYTINGVKIEGTSKLSHNTRRGIPELQNKYRISDFNRKVTQPNGDYIIYGGVRTIQKLDTDPEFPGFPDGWFRVKGSITGDELKAGQSYHWEATIDVPLIYQYCDYIVYGTMTVVFTNQDPWSVNYGSGRVCDDEAQVTISGEIGRAHV